MPIHNADIAAIFGEIADRLEIRGDNPFRIRAYRNAARGVGEFGRELKLLIESGAGLPKLPGIGADLAAKIHEIVTTGRCAALGKPRGHLPPAITELLNLRYAVGQARRGWLERDSVLNTRSAKALRAARDAGR